MARSTGQQGSAHIILVVVIVVAVIGALGYVAYNQFNKKTATTTTANQIKTTKPDVIATAQFATSIDASGVAVNPTTTFATTDQSIYLVANVAGVKPTTRIAYTRYLNDKFVDNGSIPAGKEGAKTVNFAFKEKAGAKRPAGTYKLKLYTNGAFEKEATFTVN